MGRVSSVRNFLSAENFLSPHALLRKSTDSLTVLVPVVAHPIRLPPYDPIPQRLLLLPGKGSPPCSHIPHLPHSSLCLLQLPVKAEERMNLSREGRNWGLEQEGGSCVVRDMMPSFGFCETLSHPRGPQVRKPLNSSLALQVG